MAMAGEAEGALGGAAQTAAAAAAAAGVLTTPQGNVETRWPPFPLRQYGGFWMPEPLLPGVAAVRAIRLVTRPTDVLLASFPKSGTSWLKALAFAAVNRAAHPPSDADNPLRRQSPHDCVKFFEESSDLEDTSDGGNIPVEVSEASPSSPRVLATHLPYSLLPELVTGEDGGAGCRLVYIYRDPKDTLVSFWIFTKKMAASMGVDSASFTLEKAFELFCDGRCPGGPHWSHVVEYWEASRRRPVLFLRYEEMLRRPASHLKKMAEFMGCPFSPEEEEAGVVDAIVELCSLDRMRNLEANRNGTRQHGVKNEFFFRKGVAGDWRDHMTPEMAARLDKIVDDATRGSGLTIADYV